MKTVKLFLVLSIIMSVMPLPLQGMDENMSDQDFDKFFMQSGFYDLSSFRHKLGARSVRTPQVARGLHLVYPLEYALCVWPMRIRLKKNQRYSVDYTDELVLAWISTLLEEGAPVRYNDFNPLVRLLYQYDQGEVTPDLFEKLVKLLCQHGALVDDRVEDSWVMRKIEAKLRERSASGSYVPSPLETFINGKRTVSAQDILDNVAQSKVLKAADIKQLFTDKQYVLVPVDIEDVDEFDTSLVSEPACKPRLFTMQQLATVAFISFACGIGVKYLYDWYFNTDAQDELIIDEENAHENG